MSSTNQMGSKKTRKKSIDGFKYFFIFTPNWGRFPFWLISFKGVETTNQPVSRCKLRIWTVDVLIVGTVTCLWWLSVLHLYRYYIDLYIFIYLGPGKKGTYHTHGKNTKLVDCYMYVDPHVPSLKHSKSTWKLILGIWVSFLGMASVWETC